MLAQGDARGLSIVPSGWQVKILRAADGRHHAGLDQGPRLKAGLTSPLLRTRCDLGLLLRANAYLNMQSHRTKAAKAPVPQAFPPLCRDGNQAGRWPRPHS